MSATPPGGFDLQMYNDIYTVYFFLIFEVVFLNIDSNEKNFERNIEMSQWYVLQKNNTYYISIIIIIIIVRVDTTGYLSYYTD